MIYVKASIHFMCEWDSKICSILRMIISKLGFTPCKAEQSQQGTELKKEAQKRLSLLIVDLQPFRSQITSQSKAFYRQRIPEPSCVRKET